MTRSALEPSPAGVRGRIVEASPEKLVLYLPGAGRGATVFLLMTVAGLVSAGVASVWAANQIQQGVNPDRFLKPGLLIWVLGILAFCSAFKWRFQRTFLLLDRQRLVIQHVVLGIKRRQETILVPSSRAELIPPEERTASLEGVKVMGKNRTARFGNALSPAENDWLIERINDFLRETVASAERAEQSGMFDPEDLPRDGTVVVEINSPDLLKFHHRPRRHDKDVATRAAMGGFLVAVYWLIVPIVLILGGIPGGSTLILSGLGLLIHGAALLAWSEAFGRVTVSLTQTSLACRRHLFWLDFSQRRSVSTLSIASVRIESTDEAGSPNASTAFRRVLNTLRARQATWSVICSGDQSIVLDGFSADEDARRVAALIQTRIQKYQLANSAIRGREAAFATGCVSNLHRPWRQRFLVNLWLGVATVGSVYLIDPLLLWLLPPAVLFVLGLRGARYFTGILKGPALITTAVTGLVAAWFAFTIIPFSWTTWPIRSAGGRVDPFGKRMCPPLTGMMSVCSVTFQRTGVTDRNLERVRPALLPMSDMETLDLSETEISNEGLKHLAGLTFRGVSLKHTNVTDAGLAHLTGNPELCWLYLNNTRVTDAGTAEIRKMTGLGRLHLDATQITDAGLAELQGLTHMVWLSLENTKITDAGLAHLKPMHSLYELELGNTKVTDVGLEHLQDLKGLYRLGLDNTQVTDAGIEKLRRNLPHPHLQATR